MDLTPEQRDLTGAVASKVQELGWDGDVIPFVDRIVSIIEGLIAQGPEVRGIRPSYL